MKSIYGTKDSSGIFELGESSVYYPIFFRLLEGSLKVWRAEGDLIITYVFNTDVKAEIVRRSKITMEELKQHKLEVVKTELQESCFDFLFDE